MSKQETSLMTTSKSHTRSYYDTKNADFREDFIYENGILIGHFAKNGQCFIDEEFLSLKRKLSQHSLHIPKISILAAHAHQAELHIFLKQSKSNEAIDKPEDISSEEWENFVECWSSLFKIPHCVSKVYGKQDYKWRSSIFSRMYRFLLKEFDEYFEDNRGIEIDMMRDEHGSCNIFLPDVIVVGFQRTKEIRRHFSKLKAYYKNSALEHAFNLGDVLCPFFCSKELGDNGTQFQAENELAIALKACLNCLCKFLGSNFKAKRRVVIGFACVGSMATGYVMRKRDIENHLSEPEFVLQPVDSFNLSILEDLMRLAKFLAAAREMGQDLAREIVERLKRLVASKDERNGNKSPPHPNYITSQRDVSNSEEKKQQSNKRASPDVSPKNSPPKKQKTSDSLSQTNTASKSPSSPTSQIPENISSNDTSDMEVNLEEDHKIFQK
jgi:hypothetical protein